MSCVWTTKKVSKKYSQILRIWQKFPGHKLLFDYSFSQQTYVRAPKKKLDQYLAASAAPICATDATFKNKKDKASI